MSSLINTSASSIKKVGLCDDATLVVYNKQKGYLAHPFPTWSDYLEERAPNTWNVQYSVPLKAIFFLKQAEFDEIIPINKGEAALLINESANQIYSDMLYKRLNNQEFRRKLRKRVFDNACEMAKMIPAFYLHINLHNNFWEKIENVLGWQQKYNIK